MDYWRVPAVLTCFVLLLFFAKEDSGSAKEEVEVGRYIFACDISPFLQPQDTLPELCTPHTMQLFVEWGWEPQWTSQAICDQ